MWMPRSRAVFLRQFVPCVSVPRNADSRIVVEHARNLARRQLSPIGHRHLPRVQRVAHAHAATVMEADPRRARSCVEQRIQNGPVGHGVGAVEHLFRFAIRTGHRAGIKMVASDRNGRGDFSFAHQVVHRLAHPCPLAVAEPADARGQALECEPCHAPGAASG